MSVVSAGILLFLVMDPFGNIPVFLCVLKAVPVERRPLVIFRELLIALLVLLVFLLAGPALLNLLQISEPALRIGGGIILFLIAIKMIFSSAAEMIKGLPQGEPLIVPLAIPCVAGPSAVATLLLLVAQEPDRWPSWLLALFVAWLANGVILMMSTAFGRLLGERGLSALERLMGLLLTVIAVEMCIDGVCSAARAAG